MHFIQSGNKKKKIHQIIIIKIFVHLYVFSQVKRAQKKIRNTRVSLVSVERGGTPTGLTEPFVINVNPASEGKCLHFLT